MVLRLFVIPLCLLTELHFGSGSVTLTVPTAGNCGEDTALTCDVTGSIGATGWFGLNRSLVLNGVPAKTEDNNKYTETRGASSFTLTIHNTDITDKGEYKCTNGFDESQYVRLNIECKASAADSSVSAGKKATVTVDKLYPSSPSISASFRKESTDVTILGSRTCSSSTVYPGYYRCVWSSTSSLADGSYTYSVLVTTITQADPLTGSFKIVPPETPVISNLVQLNDARVVVYGNEGQSLTISCTSTGGYPTPTVVWYKDKVSSSNQLNSTSTGTMQNDSTYTVTLQHAFIPTASDDKKTLICRSYYPQAESAYRGSKNTSVILYLMLKPSQPIVSQLANVISGGNVEVRCITTGGRPAANITWSYQGSKFQGELTSTINAATETYRVVSLLRRKVTAVDNGRTMQCVVTHTALVSPPEREDSVNLSIQFSVQTASTMISGNKIMTATGASKLTLTCTTGSSNPASDITWKNGSHTITNSRPYVPSTGRNNGVVISQQLELTPTRYMDGDVIMCSVSNTVSQSPVMDTATLNLKYSPLVDLHELQQTTLTEGTSKIISCRVDSKPSATITWYHGTNQVSEGMPSNNVLNYSLSPVNRTHYGTYRCKAKNGINPEDQEEISVSVRFKPLATTITGNNIIIANGQNTLRLICTSGSSNPISDITWKINNNTTQSTGSLTDQSGLYGGNKRQNRLTLTPSRDNDGDIVSCEASNDLGASRSKATLNLKYRPLIDPMHNKVVVEGNETVLTCIASSKPASTFKWYKQGQRDTIHEGTGTFDKNQLVHTISNVRRTDAATYRCNADNGIEGADDKTITLTVNYPPDVNAVTTNTTINAKSVMIECNAVGVPNNHYKYGNWVQKWPRNDVTVKKYTGRKNLELENLTYEHSGVYSCFASNGVKVFGTNTEYMEGAVQLLVKSYPIITTLSDKASAKLKETVTVQVDYYSNAAGSDVKCYKNVNGSRQIDFISAVLETPFKVKLPVFASTIQTDGTRAYLNLTIKSKEDFGFYDIVVSNEINSTVRRIEITPKGPPSVPSNVTIGDIQYGIISLSWIRGYHGGFAQTFVVQVSTDRTNWWNVTTVSGEKDESELPITAELTGLHDSTTYFLQMYAFNEEGNSSFTTYLNFTTLSRATEKPPVSTALIGGVAGGGSALILIIVSVIVIVILRRRGVFSKGKSDATDAENDRKPMHTDEDDDGMQDNPMYVSAGPRGEAQSVNKNSSGDTAAVYSTVDKTKPILASTSNDVYAEVNKTKKTTAMQEKRGKQEKSKKGLFKDRKGKKLAQEGDVYENALGTELKVTKTKLDANDETIYENPEPSKKVGKTNVNKDGLIYADLTFNDQPKGQKKLVIHGLDSMTEYVEVDFTKKADPLPDSDEETMEPKK